ncbi:efflux RND transporter periplasmic adaptor subunit [Burkholderiaceae bacterium DAT-1]|nr:efflux RND transporter periplasmic adaptor subunit [Burkholderiaceae bacterium DAT-1]
MRPAIKRLIGMVVLAAIAGGAYIQLNRPVVVDTTLPTVGPAVDAVYATGIVEPGTSLPIAPKTGGRLTAIQVDQGFKVKRGQILATLDDRELNHSEEEQAARATVAKQNYERARVLVDKGFLSASERDRTRADMDAAQASLTRIRTQRGDLVLRAPADGLILSKQAELGQFVQAGQAVFQYACCTPLRVTAEVDEEDVPRVKIGQPVLMRTDALPGQILRGQVSDIAPVGDSVARSTRVRIKLDEPDRLRPGMTVDTNLIIEERPKALLIPTAAVKDNSVWVLHEQTLAKQAVTTGVRGAKLVEIRSGLSATTSVVTGPEAALKEGRTVEARPAPTTSKAQ